jgi:hypothetical protein
LTMSSSIIWYDTMYHTIGLPHIGPLALTYALVLLYILDVWYS